MGFQALAWGERCPTTEKAGHYIRGTWCPPEFGVGAGAVPTTEYLGSILWVVSGRVHGKEQGAIARVDKCCEAS